MRIGDWSSDVCSSDLRFCSGPMLAYPAPDSRPEQPFLRAVWPWILAASGVCRPFISWRMRQSLGRAIRLAGMNGSIWCPEHIVAVHFLAALGAFVFIWILPPIFTSLHFSICVSFGCLVWFSCWMWRRLESDGGSCM